MQSICLKQDWQQLERILAGGRGVLLTVRGTSMLPLLRSRKDAVMLSTPSAITPGQIVLYRRGNGDVVLHRVLTVCTGGLRIAGDHQTVEETDVQPEQVLAVATHIRRGRLMFSVGHPLYRLYSTVIRHRWARLLACHCPGKV